MVISIIIPAYNAEKYIDRCISSVYKNAPSLSRFEVIVVNDGSEDGTLSIVKNYQEEYPNFVVICQQNSGVSAARNRGIDYAKGEYVLFLDVDDELVDDALGKICDYLNQCGPMDMLVTRQLRFDGHQELQVKAPFLEENKFYSGLEAYRNKYVRTNAGGGICRKSFLNSYNLRFPVGVQNSEDSLFFIQLQVYAKSIVYYDLNLYRINEIMGSASRLDLVVKAKRYEKTIQAAACIKKNLSANKEERAIFDFAIYKVVSDAVYLYSNSKGLNYFDFRKSIDFANLLPLDTENMYRFKRKAELLNISIMLFYLISWISHKLLKNK